MRFFEVVLSGAALVSAALAVEFTTFPFPSSLTAGETITLTYSPEDAATTILLKKGPSTDLDTLDTLTTSSTGGSFEWTVPSDLADGTDYAFEIQQEGAEPNYSAQFSLTGGSAPAPSSVSEGYSTSEPSSTAAASSSATEVSTTISTSVISVTSVGSASATIIPSHGLNSTISTGSPSATTTGGSPSPTTGEPPVENTGAASSFGTNPVAIFMGAVAAVAYLA